MLSEERKLLLKDLSHKKRVASDLAAQIHDLVEERLWSDYAYLPHLVQELVAACAAWNDLKVHLERMEKS